MVNLNGTLHESKSYGEIANNIWRCETYNNIANIIDNITRHLIMRAVNFNNRGIQQNTPQEVFLIQSPVLYTNHYC
jgi:hypothetical protein